MERDAIAAASAVLAESQAKIGWAQKARDRQSAAERELQDAERRTAFGWWPNAAIANAEILEEERKIGPKVGAEWLGQWKKNYPKRHERPQKPDLAAAARLLPGGWYVQFEFELARPVITLDEDSFGPTDNMVRKERATGIPCVAGSSWKGALFHAFQRLHPDWAEGRGGDVRELFGRHEANREEEDPVRGTLQFFTSHFDQTDLYMLHPLNRQTRTGTPITYEAVPIGAKAWFSLLGRAPGEPARASDVRAKKQAYAMADAVATMLCQTGFGGKTSSGFGKAKDLLATAGVLYLGGTSRPFGTLTDLARAAELR